MYKNSTSQLFVYDFVLPFTGKLDQSNRWVRLAAELDWFALEEEYSQQFSSRGGNQALPVRMAFGSLVIRQALGLSDAQTVQLICESPYLQFFIGLTDFTNQAPFSAHSMVGFRRRIPAAAVLQAAQRLQELGKQGKE